VFWLLIGGGLKDSFRDPSGGAANFAEFFFPGIVVLSVLFAAIFSTLSVIEDRHQGFLQSVLVSPTSRVAIVASKILGGALMGLLPGGLLLSLAPWTMGQVEWWGIVMALPLLFCMAGALTALSFFFAWKIDSVQGFHGVMNLLLMPLWLLSGSVFPLSGSHPVFQWIGQWNPLAWGVSALRAVLQDASLSPLYSQSVIAFFVATLLLGVGAVGLVQKSQGER
jgi:ABC-type multidrug transport system permease subunit